MEGDTAIVPWNLLYYSSGIALFSVSFLEADPSSGAPRHISTRQGDKIDAINTIH